MDAGGFLVVLFMIHHCTYMIFMKSILRNELIQEERGDVSWSGVAHKISTSITHFLGTQLTSGQKSQMSVTARTVRGNFQRIPESDIHSMSDLCTCWK